METLPLKEVFKGAKAALQKYGWQQYDIGGLKEDGEPTKMCILGAVNFAEHGRPSYTIVPSTFENVDAEPLYFKKLAEAIGVSGICAVANWNNRAERTEEEVLTALDRAIELS